VSSIYLAAEDGSALPAAQAGLYVTLRVGGAGQPPPSAASRCRHRPHLATPFTGSAAVPAARSGACVLQPGHADRTAPGACRSRPRHQGHAGLARAASGRAGLCLRAAEIYGRHAHGPRCGRSQVCQCSYGAVRNPASHQSWHGRPRRPGAAPAARSASHRAACHLRPQRRFGASWRASLTWPTHATCPAGGAAGRRCAVRSGPAGSAVQGGSARLLLPAPSRRRPGHVGPSPGAARNVPTADSVLGKRRISCAVSAGRWPARSLVLAVRRSARLWPRRCR
jgi:hypothetical protein